MKLLDKYCNAAEYKSHAEFYNSFRLNEPVDFNFGFDIIDELAKMHPEKRAMLWVSSENEEREFTFKDLSDLSSRAANALSSLGIHKGDIVLLALKRHYQYWHIMLGMHKLGAIPIPVTHMLTARDYSYRFNASGARMAITTLEDDVPKQLQEALKDSPSVEMLAAVRSPKTKTAPLPDGFLEFDALVEVASPVFPRPFDAACGKDVMMLYFTSGTTGYSKMVAHDFYYPFGHISTANYWHCVEPDGLHFTISDSGWAKAAWGKMYGQWMCEGAILVYDFERFCAADILSKLEKYRVTTFCAPPTMYRYIIREPLETYELSSLKHVTTAGEALNPEVFEQFKSKVGLEIYEGFGQTETTLLLATFPFMKVRTGSMGLPAPGYKVCLLNNDGTPTTLGETGEICIDTSEGKPPGMFMGYYKDEKRTAKVWHDGWYHTGDTAWQDGKGYFWYVGRMDDVIKSSGYRIGPFEVESALMEHPAVLECAVTPVPDPARGQAIKATVVLTKEYSPSEELIKELQVYVKKATAPYKYPRIIEFTEALPKTVSGKIKRAVIRERDRLAYEQLS